MIIWMYLNIHKYSNNIFKQLIHPFYIVKILDLSDNALGEKGLRACFPLLQNQEALIEISFCNNGMSARASEVIADEILLFRGPDVPTLLQKFHFYNNMSGDGGAMALSRVIRQSPQLTHLRLVVNMCEYAFSIYFDDLNMCEYIMFCV